MKKFILATLMLFSSFAFADRVDDMKKWPDMQYCMQTSTMFKQGFDANTDGFARKITRVGPKEIEILEHGGKLPRSSMWLMDGVDTEQEAKFLEDLVFLGWDEADKLKDITSEQRDKLVQTYFEGCMYKRTAERTAPKQKINFHKTASSDKIAKPSEETCEEITWDLNVIEGAIEAGVLEENVKAFANSSENAGNITSERNERIQREITEAYGPFQNNLEEWKTKELKGCD